MSSVTEHDWQVAKALAEGSISEREFCDALSVSPEQIVDFGLGLLRRAMDEQDPEAAEFGLYIGARFGFAVESLGILERLASEDWHMQHENVVEALAKLRSPSSIETLYRTALARFKYLDYDESFSLGVKCIWALGSIKAEGAVIRLGELLSCGNGVLERNATEQLFRIQERSHSPVLQETVRKTLEAKHRTE